MQQVISIGGKAFNTWGGTLRKNQLVFKSSI